VTNTQTAPNRPRARGIVLDLIRATPLISRVELVGRSGLTGATITNVVRELIDDGLVHEVGRSESRGGKPRTLLELNAGAGYTVGVQLDRFSGSIVIVDLAGHLIGRTAIKGPGVASPHVALVRLARQIEALLTDSDIDRSDVFGVGLATLGPQDRALGTLLSPQPTPLWLGLPMAAELEKILGLPVLLDNDATAAAIGEYWVGGVELNSSYGCIYMAGGIGGGVVIDGEAYRGGSSNAVEIGHITMDAAGLPCSCGNRGCLEDFAGPTSIVTRALQWDGVRERLNLSGDIDDTVLDLALINRAAIGGDPDARSLIEYSARYLGYAAVSLVNLFDLERIVLAGPSFAIAGALYLPIVQAELDGACFARRAHPVIASLSASGADAAAVGGAVLVLRSELTPLLRRHAAP